MIRSMTGFAIKSLMLTLGETKVPITLSLKSLNSRYFDCNCKMPYPLANLETQFITLFKTHLLRGSITFMIHLGGSNAFKGTIEPSIPTIKSYLDALDTIKKTCDIQGTLSLSDLLVLPNIFVTQEQDLDESTKNILLQVAQELIDQLIIMQCKEGLVLKQDILKRIAIIQKEIEAISIAFEILMKNQKQKVNETLIQVENDSSKLAEAQKNNVYALLDKMDIHEEIVRFKNHLSTLSKSLESKDIEKGKRIDFILQELFREVSTITAKCADGAISSHAINIKVELEKAREQTQNIV